MKRFSVRRAEYNTFVYLDIEDSASFPSINLLIPPLFLPNAIQKIYSWNADPDRITEQKQMKCAPPPSPHVNVGMNIILPFVPHVTSHFLTSSSSLTASSGSARSPSISSPSVNIPCGSEGFFSDVSPPLICHSISLKNAESGLLDSVL